MRLVLLDGYIAYHDVVNLFQDIKTGVAEEKIFILEHQDVYTAGKSVNISNDGDVAYRVHGVEAIRTERGGLWTWHGKGQVVAYFIYNLKKHKSNLSEFLHKIEGATLHAIWDEVVRSSDNNIQCGHIYCYADSNRRGFWVKYRRSLTEPEYTAKFGFIGLRVSHGYVCHGISINYNNDLQWFDYINPCGLGEVNIASVETILQDNQQLKKPLDINDFKKKLGYKLLEALDETR